MCKSQPHFVRSIVRYINCYILNDIYVNTLLFNMWFYLKTLKILILKTNRNKDYMRNKNKYYKRFDVDPTSN